MTLSCYGFDFANTIHIWSNTIDYCRIGIHAENISDIKIGLDPNGIVKFNTINYFLGLTPTSGIYYEGIWLQSCNRAAIINTTILNNAIATGTNMFKGVDVENSTNCQINCNNITNIPYSMNFLGYCAGTLLRRNVMTEYDVAINTMGATLPFQGAEISPGVWKSLDNEWYDLGTSNRIGTLSQQINWYYKSPGVQFQPFPNQGNITPQSTGSGNPQCGDLLSPPRDERFGAIVGDSLDFDEYVEENTYTAKADAYQAIKNDSTLLVQGDLNDVAFQEFFSEMSQTNIGGFAEVEELIADSVFVSQAGLLNTSIVDTNSIEFYRKTVNDIYINGPAAGISLTAADSLTLQMIANLQWTLAGNAIYSAANMIGLEIHPAYIPLRKKNIKEDEQENIKTKVAGISVYPNPASEKLIVKGLTNQNTSIIIHNSANENVLELEITKYEHVIDVSNYTDGIYYLFVKNKKINYFQTKFSIIK
ncbi:MAG: hypothetical protein IPP71_11575 [Bacteroidetes bacterium]|nr:hypothetical protein [Bacteroidota bacterium]